MPRLKTNYDALVIGAGIAGMQCSLDLASQGFSVLLVEKQPSIGGIMVGLNKVFPTLDCSSCICTPRMAETAHNPNITIQTYTEVRKVEKVGRSFVVRLLKKPRYVNEDTCIGCSECERACPVDVPHEFDYGFGARRAVYIAGANAIPMIATLDIDNCIFCGKCAQRCPTEAMDFTQQPEEVAVTTGAVVVASGLGLTPMNIKPEYGDGKMVNVINPLAMERLQASDSPFGHVLRPSDGKIPKSIAYIKCAGSRDKSIGIPYCSRVCCMYSMKQAILMKQKDPEVEITLYHMDIRAFGKGYEQFYRRALKEGINIIKAKVAKITEDNDHNPIVRVEFLDEGGRVAEVKHDLIVLASGIVPGWRAGDSIPSEQETDGFFRTPFAKISPTLSTTEGIFLAGVATGPKDIPDAIVEAGAAAMEAANYLVKAMAHV